MPRRKPIRRFEPRYGVSQLAVEEEAKALSREIEDHEVLAPTDVQTKCVERHANCRHSWEHLQELLDNLPEREERIIQCLLFRDIYHILELYLTCVRSLHPERPSLRPVPQPLPRGSDEFSEWLFDPVPTAERRSPCPSRNSR